jgi:hypothetical protein
VAKYTVLRRHFGVAEAKDAEALAREPSVPMGVCKGVMERAIGFDDQATPEADEVNDIRPNGNLSAEF